MSLRHCSIAISVLQIDALNLRHLLKSGDIEKLEYVVLEGQGKKLIGEYSPDFKTRVFLKSVPNLMVGRIKTYTQCEHCEHKE